MKTRAKPIRTTIILGLICGLGYIPLSVFFTRFIPESVTFRFMLWTNLAVYAYFLTRWGKQTIHSIIFPLLIPIIFLFMDNTLNTYLILLTGILSWIRSGICFPNKVLRKIGIELLVCAGGGMLIDHFSPHSFISWAIGIWLFHLVQSLYFISHPQFDSSLNSDTENDSFEQARMQAEKILEGR